MRFTPLALLFKIAAGNARNTAQKRLLAKSTKRHRRFSAQPERADSKPGRSKTVMLLRAFLMSKKRLLKGAEKGRNLSLSTRQPLAPILGTPLLHVDIARSAVRPRLKPFAQQGNFFHQIHRQGGQLRVCVKLALQIGHAPRAR